VTGATCAHCVPYYQSRAFSLVMRDITDIRDVIPSSGIVVTRDPYRVGFQCFGSVDRAKCRMTMREINAACRDEIPPVGCIGRKCVNIAGEGVTSPKAATNSPLPSQAT